MSRLGRHGACRNGNPTQTTTDTSEAFLDDPVRRRKALKMTRFMECFRDPRNDDSDFGEGVFAEEEINAELQVAASVDAADIELLPNSDEEYERLWSELDPC